jgi:ABC-2 type transport system ATP-binding protein
MNEHSEHAGSHDELRTFSPTPPAPDAAGTGAATAAPPALEHPAVELRDLTKRYGSHVALDRVSLVVPAGSVCGLIGPNGAGKSTMMSIIATLLRPTAGSASVFGVPATDTAVLRRLIGYVPDVLGMYTGLSVEEYLSFFADAYGIGRDQRSSIVDGLLELVDLQDKRDADLNTLSRGMKQRIGLARGLVHEPQLLILDEPARGLDPPARLELRDIIAHLRSAGVTVMISSHILSELEEMCTHAIVLEQGRLVGLEDLRDDPGRSVTISFVGGGTERFLVTSDQEQAELVARLVREGRPVLSVTTESTRLEDRFMRMTDGRVN